VREIVLGNGNLLVNFDGDLNLRDLYWPYGGFENHGDGNRTSFGVYTDGRFSWLFEKIWNKEIRYISNSPVTEIRATNAELGLELLINDAVHWAEDFYLKKVLVRNLAGYQRRVKLIFYQDFSIRGIEAGDSAVYDPDTRGIYHYKKGCYILANCKSRRSAVNEYSAGVKRYRGREGTHRDAEDGYLSGNPVADGPVDSALAISLDVEPGGQEEAYYWLILSHDLKSVRAANARFLKRPPEAWLEEIVNYHRHWIKRQNERDFGDLSTRAVELFKTSLFAIRAQIDRKGAVVASSDADTFLVSRDHYMYLWPRDGAMVAHALDLAGYAEETRKFYKFCAGLLADDGYFLQRYNPDGSPGCTWHPWLMYGRPCPPIQEDETALVIWALGEHFRLFNDVDFIASVFPELVKPAVSFMIGYIDDRTRLPLPSWDLWEERWGVFAFTSGAVYGALAAGARMAEALGDGELAQRCYTICAMLREGITRHLYQENLARFIRGFMVDEKGDYHPDLTLDSSVYGLHAFGAFDSHHEPLVRTMEIVKNGLWVKTGIGGMARYTNDYYHQVSDNIAEVPGNPWIVTTLWLADWYIDRAARREELEPARQLIDWAAQRSSRSGAMPEQVHPFTGQPLSVVPLTWSHSSFVRTVLAYLEKMKQLDKTLH